MFPAPSTKPLDDIPVPPPVPAGLALHWGCFVEVLSSRPGAAFATGDVLDYCRFYGIEDPDLRRDLLEVTRLLGANYRDILKQNREQSAALAKRLAGRKTGGPPRPPPRGRR